MNLGERTIDCYSSIAKQFFYGLNKSPVDITLEELELFVFQKSASRSKEQALAVLKHLYRNIFHQPEKVNHIPLPKREEYLPTILTIPEINIILSHPLNIKHRAVLTLIYSCALRISEAINLEFKHINSKEKYILIKAGKGRKDRIVPIPQDTINLLREYCKEWKPHLTGKYLFQGQRRGEKYSIRSIQIKFTNAVLGCGIEKDVSVHNLRHSRATHWLDNGVNIRKIQVALGHKKVTTTEIYCRVSIQSMAEAFIKVDERIKAQANIKYINPQYQFNQLSA
jgi:integrase/recombinase XerD